MRAVRVEVAGRLVRKDHRGVPRQRARNGNALLLAEASGHSSVGVVVDSYHSWWDPQVLDQIARAGLSFRYTEAGPEGLLKGKRAIFAYTAGGTPFGSDLDFASGYLRFMLGFLGITDVEFVAADGLAFDREAGLARAHEALEKLAA